MKVKELIEKLSKEDPEEEILKLSEDDWCYDLGGISRVRIDNTGYRTDNENYPLSLVIH